MSIQGQPKSTYVGKLASVRAKVEHFLAVDRTLADNDGRLVSNIWHLEVMKQGKNPKTMTGAEMLELIANKKVTSADSITRARRQVEEEMPELRGDTWEARQNLEKEVRQDINQPVKEKTKKKDNPNQSKFSI